MLCLYQTMWSDRFSCSQEGAARCLAGFDGWGGGKSVSTSAALRFRPTLTALDERAVPDATPLTPPPPAQVIISADTTSFTFGAGQWLYLDGEGDNAGWLAVGDDGGVWFVTGGETNPQWVPLAAWDLTDGPAVGMVLAQNQVPPMNPPAPLPGQPAPPNIAPPPRPAGGLPPFQPGPLPLGVPPPDPVQPAPWTLNLSNSGGIRITGTNGTYIYIDSTGKITIYQNGQPTITIPPPPKK